MLLHAGMAWWSRPPGILTGQDDAEYVMLGRSLRAGGYHELHRIDRPVHAQYPPGYPALLAAWGAAAGDDFDALVLLNVGISAALLAAVYATLRRRGFGEVEATGSVVVLAVNPALVAMAGSLRSEPPYTLLSMVCLLMLAAREPRAGQRTLAGAAAIVAALTRSIGVTLVAAVAAHWLIERRWKTLTLFAGAAALTLGSWLAWTALAPERYTGSSYIGDLTAGTGERGTLAPKFPDRIPEHISWYARIGVPWMLGVPTVQGTVLDNAIALLLLVGLGGLGVWTFARRWRPAALYLGVYGALLAVWVWRVERFVIPLLPIIVAAVLVGAGRLGTLLRLRRPWLAVVATALVLFAGGVARTTEDLAEAARCDRSAQLPDAECLTADQASFFEAVRWIRTHTAEDAVFLTAKSAPFWLYTGRRTISYGTARRTDTLAVLPFLREQATDYVLLTALERGEPRRLAPRLLRVCGALALEASFPPNGYLFRIRAPDERMRAGPACGALRDYLEANRGRWEPDGADAAQQP